MNAPHPQDAVLGGVSATPPESAVLGGLEGVQQRLRHPQPVQRVAALRQLTRYGQDGLTVIAQALQDPALDVQRVAYSLLRESASAIAQTALHTYCPYPLFEPCATLQGHAQGITAVALSPDESTIVSSSRDRMVIVWDVQAQEAYLSFAAPFFVSTLSVSADGRSVLLRDMNQQTRVWSLRNGQELPPDAALNWATDGMLPPPVTAAGISQLAQGWLDDQAQWFTPDWATSSDPSHPPLVSDSDPQANTQSDRPKLRSIASTTLQSDRYLLSSSQSSIRIWDLHQGREIAVLQGHTSLVTAIAAAPRGQWIASGSEDRTVILWGIP